MSLVLDLRDKLELFADTVYTQLVLTELISSGLSDQRMRLSKWDEADDRSSVSSLQAAAEAAARVNAQLIANGKLKPSRISALDSHTVILLFASFN